MVEPYFLHKTFMVQQHKDAFKVFYDFLKEVRPSRILEIGTAGGGGFILFVRETLNDMGLSSTDIQSFDIVDRVCYIKLKKIKININLVNLFDKDYTHLVQKEAIQNYIQKEGTTIVLCDGGNKITEFNSIAPLIKKMILL